jgi:hypothetical protein
MALSDQRSSSNGTNNILQALLDLAVPNASADTLDKANKMDSNSTQQKNAYQKGVDKALSEYGYNHGTEAIASGMNPNDIANHEVMQQPSTASPHQGEIGPEHMAVLQTLLSLAPGQNNQQANSQVLTPLQQQALDIVKPATSIFGKLMENMGNAGIVRQGQLANLAAAQKIAAGQPAEVALPQAQAGLVGVEAATKQAELSAGAPQANVELTKQQTEASKQDILNKQAEIKAGIYKTQTERVVQHIQRLTERRKQIADQMNDDLKNGPIIGRGDRLKEYRRQLNWFDKQINDTSGISDTKDSSDNGFISTPGGNKFKRL